jgi:hypothetical protein
LEWPRRSRSSRTSSPARLWRGCRVKGCSARKVCGLGEMHHWFKGSELRRIWACVQMTGEEGF